MGYQYALFDTPLGTCGIAWSDRGIRRLHLPEATREATERKLLSGLGQPATSAAPPAPVRRVLERVAQHLSGAPQDFADLLLDLDAVPPFHRKVYEVALAAPSGRTLTYGEVARLAGSPGASRAVGQALAKNPLPILVPCHRVLAAGNRPGGFTAFGGTDTKARLLGMEGVALPVHPSERPLPFDWDEAVRTLSRADPRLSRLMREVGPVRLTLRPPQSPFESLAQSIVYQQLSGKAAATILGRVRGLFPRKKLTAKGLLGLSDEQLRSAGLSRPKMLAMRDLAAKALDGTVPRAAELEKLSDEALIERLTRVRGIGQWTVEMILIFRLGRPDVLPVNDLGVRKGFAITYGGELPAPKALHELGERWRPFRTVASWFFWRATELPQEAREKLARERPVRQKPGRSTPGRTGGSAA
jgi:methylated-DNA-[protein]-cysteine S-methyltransferase